VEDSVVGVEMSVELVGWMDVGLMPVSGEVDVVVALVLGVLFPALVTPGI
jgi:hypothetical protein